MAEFRNQQLVTVLPSAWRSESGPARIVAVDVAPGAALVTMLAGSTAPGLEFVIPYERLRLSEKEKPRVS